MIRRWLVAAMLFFTSTLRADEPRVDAFGDPLPAGVLAQMGTTRLRHGDSVYLTHFVQDGRWLLSTGGDGTARLWDSGTGKEHRRFPHRPTGQRWVYPRLSPDG